MMLGAAFDGFPTQAAAYARDAQGFAAMFDLAMLVVADICIQKSHLAAISTPLRHKLGKAPCLPLKSKSKLPMAAKQPKKPQRRTP